MQGEATDRERSGKTTALVGVVLNIILGALKLAAGALTGSVAIVSDGINNLSDAGSGGVTFASMVLSSRRADSAHPLGHGRYEYVAGIVMACIILFAAAELLDESIRGVIYYSAPAFSAVALWTLVASIAVKGFMGVFYLVRNRRTGYAVLGAAAADSFSDCAFTAVVTVAFAAAPSAAFPIDGAAGILAAIAIGFCGVRLMLRTINKLLGSGRDAEVEAHLAELIRSEPAILGFHDPVVHDYGAERKFATVDAEFDRDLPFFEVHAAVDRVERAAKARFGIDLRVHCDPVDRGERYTRVRSRIEAALAVYGSEASFHELVIVDAERKATVHLRLGERLMRERDHVLAEVMEAVDAELDGYIVEAVFDFL